MGQSGVCEAGSSPHARGTHSLAEILAGECRFIPACAGNAMRPRRVHSGRTVHPRMRGERRAERGRTGSLGGSSPHARGTQVSGRPDRMAMRFIPACAGNARTPGAGAGTVAVHPRMRGERCPRLPASHDRPGSSPHARGTRRPHLPGSRSHRFIPACAGNAAGYLHSGSPNSVHPRMRGERTSNKLLIYRRKSEPSDSTKHSAC